MNGFAEPRRPTVSTCVVILMSKSLARICGLRGGTLIKMVTSSMLCSHSYTVRPGRVVTRGRGRQTGKKESAGEIVRESVCMYARARRSGPKFNEQRATVVRTIVYKFLTTHVRGTTTRRHARSPFGGSSGNKQYEEKRVRVGYEQV